jgi:hypothetical protein
MSNDIDPALPGAIMWYSVDVYDHIEHMGWDSIHELALSASEALQLHPLHKDPDGTFPMIQLPSYANKKSIIYCCAIASSIIVWTQKHMNDNPLPGSTLLQSAYDGYRMWLLTRGHDE